MSPTRSLDLQCLKSNLEQLFAYISKVQVLQLKIQMQDKKKRVILYLFFRCQLLSQFLNDPTVSHRTGCKSVLRCLKVTQHHGLFINPTPTLDLIAYSDADRWNEYDTDLIDVLLVASAFL